MWMSWSAAAWEVTPGKGARDSLYGKRALIVLVYILVKCANAGEAPHVVL